MESATTNAKQLQSCTSAEPQAEDVNKLQLTANVKGGATVATCVGSPTSNPSDFKTETNGTAPSVN